MTDTDPTNWYERVLHDVEGVTATADPPMEARRIVTDDGEFLIVGPLVHTEAGTPLTAEQLVPFLLSAIASGERLTADEVATIRALDAARSRPATDSAGLDEAWAVLRNSLSKAYVAADIDAAIASARPRIEAAVRLSVADGPGPRVSSSINDIRNPYVPIGAAGCVGCERASRGRFPYFDPACPVHSVADGPGPEERPE